MIFGKSRVRDMPMDELAAIGRYLRHEPLWPLLKSIWKLRRMDPKAFALADYILDPLGPERSNG